MVIEGKELDMKYYDVEKGKMNIQGKIDKIEYKDKKIYLEMYQKAFDKVMKGITK